ncbi:hypothetical protein BDR03DRAFT_1000754 [Suillus americanus]|nr:hypothetical protein BDR03DRAFT_1000754 [Suillus americanus]
METGTEKVHPTASTYAIMLLACAELGQTEFLGSYIQDALQRSSLSRDSLNPGRGRQRDTNTSSSFKINSVTTHVLLDNRRTLLEESDHDVAVEHLRHESTLNERSLRNRELREDLQKWASDLHETLKARIEAVIKDIIAAEGKTDTGIEPTSWAPHESLVKPAKLS